MQNRHNTPRQLTPWVISATLMALSGLVFQPVYAAPGRNAQHLSGSAALKSIQHAAYSDRQYAQQRARAYLASSGNRVAALKHRIEQVKRQVAHTRQDRVTRRRLRHLVDK